MTAPTAACIAEAWRELGRALQSNTLDRAAVALIWQMAQANRPLTERDIVKRTVRGPWPDGPGAGPPELQRWRVLGMAAGRYELPRPLYGVLWQDLQDDPHPGAFSFDAWLALRYTPQPPAEPQPKRTGTRNPIPRAIRRIAQRRRA